MNRPTTATALVYRDSWTSSPWTADLTFDDGQVWKGWKTGFSTLTGLMKDIQAVTLDIDIERRKDMDK